MITGLFFVFLVISFFLGDGKQGFIEVFWAIATVLLYVFFWYQKEKIKPLPPKIWVLWLVFMGYVFLRGLLSDSVGLSISAFIRILEGFLIYLLFYSLSSSRELERFSYYLMGLVAIAILTSWAMLVVPGLALYLPPVNLLLLTYGHNHLADLIIFAFPSVVFFYQKKPSLVSFGVFTLFFLGLIGTFARGAWILVLGFFALSIFWQKKEKFYLPRVLKVAFLVLGLSLFAIAITPLLPFKTTSDVSLWKKHMARPFLVNDGRWEYWHQAILGIADRPFFGSGPGTFELVSKRFQSRPFSFSWYSHSFPLGTLAELGLVGALILFILLFLHWRQFLHVSFSKHQTPVSLWFSPLFWGLSLTLIYSFFEFNLDLLVIWLLFWAILGTIFGATRPSDEKRKIIYMAKTLIFLTILFLFYLFSFFGVLTSVFIADKRIAGVITPYDATMAKQYYKFLSLEKPPFVTFDQDYVGFFHQQNPDVLTEQASYLQKTRQDDKAINLYRKTLLRDPKNPELYRSIFNYFIKQKLFFDVGKILMVMGQELFTGPQEKIDQIDFQSGTLLRVYETSLFSDLPEHADEHYLSKTYYFLGLKVFNDDPQTTKLLWEIAKEQSPQWSYFHIELASLLKYQLKDTFGAIGILKECLKQPLAASHCEKIKIENLPPPGAYKQKILNIL